MARSPIGGLLAILVVAAGFLFYTGTLQDLIGLVLMAVGIGIHLLRVRSGPAMSGAGT